MSRVGAFDFDRVVVMPHALLQARDRLYSEFCGIEDGPAKAMIEEQVRVAIEAGHVFDVKPKPFRMFGQTRRDAMLSWQRFVMSRDGQRGWVIALDALPDVVVVTTLSRIARVRVG